MKFSLQNIEKNIFLILYSFVCFIKSSLVSLFDCILTRDYRYLIPDHDAEKIYIIYKIDDYYVPTIYNNIRCNQYFYIICLSSGVIITIVPTIVLN